MTTEEKRHRLYMRLGDVLGDEEAATLMEQLPPVGIGWADVARRDEVATKADLEQLRGEVKADLAELRGEIKAQGGELRAEFHNALRMQFYAILAAMAGQGALVLAAAKAIH
jgi:hypothetical protein